MLRIVGVQRSGSPHSEFILLQNQGAMRIELSGHALMTEAEGLAESGLYVFRERESIPAGRFVMLTTAPGTPRWERTKDGQTIYHVYANRTSPIWAPCLGPVSVLGTQHTFSARREAIALV